MRYFGGALLEPPPEGPNTVLFLFFSLAASQAFMVPSWSMAALASSLYDRFWERITILQLNSELLVKELSLLRIHINMVNPVLR
jgi:hypothetical protein